MAAMYLQPTYHRADQSSIFEAGLDSMMFDKTNMSLKPVQSDLIDLRSDGSEDYGKNILMETYNS